MMVVVMQPEAQLPQISAVLKLVEAEGLTPHVARSAGRTVVGVIDPPQSLSAERFSALPGVEEVTGLSKPFKLTSREFSPMDSLVHVGNVVIGGPRLCLI